MTKTEQIGELVGSKVREWMLEADVPINSCILMTRFAVDILEQFSIKSQPMACFAHVFVGDVVKFIVANNMRLPENEKQVAEMRSYSGILAAIGMSPDHKRAIGPDFEWGGAYEAHCVAVTDDGWLIDASLDQANSFMTQVGSAYRVPNLVRKVPSGIAERIGARIPFQLPGGALAVYEPVESPVPFEELEDWVFTPSEQRQWMKLVNHFAGMI